MGVMDTVITWLLEGDSAVAYQTCRDLLDQDRPDLRATIGGDGDARTILAARNADSHWARGFYQPKWTSTHRPTHASMEWRSTMAPWFGAAVEDLAGIVDFLLSQGMPDGGYNCRRNRSGARIASVHTTLA